MFNFIPKYFPLFRIKIKEKSMQPYLEDGDIVVVIKYFFTKPKSGDVIIFKHTTPPFIFIKRVTKVLENKFWVEGDNKKESFDSRRFGFIKLEQVLGKMIFKL